MFKKEKFKKGNLVATKEASFDDEEFEEEPEEEQEIEEIDEEPIEEEIEEQPKPKLPPMPKPKEQAEEKKPTLSDILTSFQDQIIELRTQMKDIQAFLFRGIAK